MVMSDKTNWNDQRIPVRDRKLEDAISADLMILEQLPVILYL